MARKKKAKIDWDAEVEKIKSWIGQKSPSELIDLLLYGTAAFTGGRAAYYLPGFRTPQGITAGAISGMISMKLATSKNAVSGAAGLIGLAALGIANAPSADMEIHEVFFESFKKQLESWFFPLGTPY